MASAAQIAALNITVNGYLNPNLLAAINRAESQLKAFGASQKTQAAAMARVYNQAFGPIGTSFQKANTHALVFHSTLKQIATTAASVSIGELITKGLENGVGMIENILEKVRDVASESSKMAAAWELRAKGMASLLHGDQAMADQIMETERKLAIASPFKAPMLQLAAKRMIGAGFTPGGAQEITQRGGDIIAGIGGSGPEMERFALVMAKIRSSGFMSGREGREFEDLGIPYEETLKKIMNVTSEGFLDAQKKHKITLGVVEQMIRSMTSEGGIFFEAMKHFAETFTGLETSISDMMDQARVDLGNLLNDWAKLAADFALHNDLWDKLHQWMMHLRVLNTAVVNFVATIPSSQLFAGFEPFLHGFQKMIGDFNTWISSFFTMQYMPGIGSSPILNATGKEKVMEVFDYINKLFSEIYSFLTADATQRVMGFTWEKIVDGLRLLFTTIQEMVVLADDMIRGDLGKFMSDFHKFEFEVPAQEGARRDLQHAKMAGFGDYIPWGSGSMYIPGGQNQFGVGGHVESEADRQKTQEEVRENTLRTYNEVQKTNDLLYDISQAVYTSGPSIGGNFGLHGDVSSGGSLQGLTYYGPGQPGDDVPHRGTWDSDSYRGIGHIHGVEHHLISGSSAMKPGWAEGHYHILPGQWYRSDKTGKLQRWDDTTGARNPENEDIYVPKAGGGASINITNHIYAMDSHGVDRVMREHGETIADHIRRVWDGQDSRRAAV